MKDNTNNRKRSNISVVKELGKCTKVPQMHHNLCSFEIQSAEERKGTTS